MNDLIFNNKMIDQLNVTEFELLTNESVFISIF